MRRRPDRAVGHLELAVRGCAGAAAAARRADARRAALAVGDQHGLAQARVDRRGGVADVQHERAAADAGAVDPVRRDAEVVGDRGRRSRRRWRRRRCRCGLSPASAMRVERRVGVQPDLRQCSGCTPSSVVSAAPTMATLSASCASALRRAEQRQRDLVARSCSNATSSGMSSCSASGVCGQSTMLVIMRGPSSSSTTAIA